MLHESQERTVRIGSPSEEAGAGCMYREETGICHGFLSAGTLTELLSHPVGHEPQENGREKTSAAPYLMEAAGQEFRDGKEGAACCSLAAGTAVFI